MMDYQSNLFDKNIIGYYRIWYNMIVYGGRITALSEAQAESNGRKVQTAEGRGFAATRTTDPFFGLVRVS
jgi:hypothetical protein